MNPETQTKKDKKYIFADSQILTCVQSCPYQTFLRFEKSLQLPNKPEPLERGDLLHRLLEIYYGLMGHCCDFNNEMWKDIKEQGFKIPDYENDNAKTRVRNKEFALSYGNYFAGKLEMEDTAEVLFQFNEYCNHYIEDAWIPLAVEKTGSKVLYDSPELCIVYTFKIDLIAQFCDEIVPWDHKTRRKRTIPIDLNNQFMGYAFGLAKTKLMENVIGFQKTLSPNERFQRFKHTYTEPRLNEWIKNSIYWLLQYNNYKESGYWPQNFTSCDKFSGCNFISLCKTNRDDRDWKAERDYIIGDKWDPTKDLEKESGD